MRTLSGFLFRALFVLTVLSEASTASAQTFSGSLTSGVGNFWYRPGSSCVQETKTRLYQRIRVYADNPGTYTFTATRAGGAAVAMDAYRVFPSTNCQTDRYAYGTSGAGSASVTVVVSDINYPIHLIVSSGTDYVTGAYTVTVSGPSTVSGDCSASGSLTPSSQAAPIGGGTYGTTYTPPASVECSGFVIRNKPFWISGLPTTGGGTTALSYTAAANTGGPRSASVRIGQQTLLVSQAGTCTYAFSPTSMTVSGAGGTYGTNISVNSGCEWSATTATPWITLLAPNGTGPRALSFTVAANTGAARSGTITVGGKTFTVNQNAACTYTLAPTSVSLTAAGSTQDVSVTTQVGCPTTGSANVAWITPHVSNIGASSTSFSVASNSGPTRIGTLTLGNATVSVEQASGCVISLPSTSRTVGSTGTSSSFVVETGAGCEFTATSNAAWLTASPAAASVSFVVSPSVEASRAGTITVTSTSTASSAQFAITQSSGCVPDLVSGGEARDAAGGTGSVAVSTAGGCAFTATSDVPWIGSIATDASGVSFAVEANDGPERSGTLTIASAGGSVQYSIMQANGCTISLGANSLEGDGWGDSPVHVEVFTGVGCTWTAASSDGWISPATFEEPTSFWLEPNEGAARVGNVTFTAGESGATAALTITQPSMFEPPTIFGQPISQSRYVGDAYMAEVSVDSGGAGSVTYQWRKDGVDIPGETFETLWLQDLTLEDTGAYDVVVSNLAGSTTSEVAQLNVLSPPETGCSISAVGARGSSAPMGMILAAVFLVWARRRPRRAVPTRDR